MQEIFIRDYREIYKNDSKAIKIYTEGESFEYVTEMARIQALAYDTGLPVPAIYGVKDIGGQYALEMDYLKSEPWQDENISKSERIELLKIMAGLQYRLNTVNAESFGLPKFTMKITDEIKRSPYLTEQIKNKLLELLARLDTGKTSLCHGDFHVGNVVFDGEKYWIIDWDGACMGDPIADACMTYFYEKRYNPQTADIYMREKCEIEADIYLQEYCRISNIKHEDFLVWQPIVAAYQVNIKTEDQRDYIVSVINEWYTE